MNSAQQSTRHRSRRSGRRSSGRTRRSTQTAADTPDDDEHDIGGGLSDQDLERIESIVQQYLSTASQRHRIEASTRRMLNLFNRKASFDLSGEALRLSFRRGEVAEHMSGRLYPVCFDMSSERSVTGDTTYHVSGLKTDTTRNLSIKKHIGSEPIRSTEYGTTVDFDMRLWPEVQIGWNDFPGAAEAFTHFLLDGGDAMTIRLKLGRVYTQICIHQAEPEREETGF